jgi:hypothetical protein
MAIEILGDIYPEKIIEDLKNLAESITYLNDGLNDPVLRDYIISKEELAT